MYKEKVQIYRWQGPKANDMWQIQRSRISGDRVQRLTIRGRYKGPEFQGPMSKAEADCFPLDTGTPTIAHFPGAAYQRQEEVFAKAFAVLRQAIAALAFPSASVAVTYREKLVALQAFGRSNSVHSPQL